MGYFSTVLEFIKEVPCLLMGLVTSSACQLEILPITGYIS